MSGEDIASYSGATKTRVTGEIKSFLTKYKSKFGSSESALEEGVQELIKLIESLMEESLKLNACDGGCEETNRKKLSTTLEEDDGTFSSRCSEEKNIHTSHSAYSVQTDTGSVSLFSISNDSGYMEIDEEDGEDDNDDEDEDKDVRASAPSTPCTSPTLPITEDGDITVADQIDEAPQCNCCMEQQKTKKKRRLTFKAVRKYLKKPFRSSKNKMNEETMYVCEMCCSSSHAPKVKKKCSLIRSLKKLKRNCSRRSKKDKTGSTSVFGKVTSVSSQTDELSSPSIEENAWTHTPPQGIESNEKVVNYSASKQQCEMTGSSNSLNSKGKKKSPLFQSIQRCSRRFSGTSKTFAQDKVRKDRTDSVFLIPEGENIKTETNRAAENEDAFQDTYSPNEGNITILTMAKDCVETSDERSEMLARQKGCSFNQHEIQEILKSIEHFTRLLQRKSNYNYQEEDDFEDIEFPFHRDASFRHVMSKQQHEFRKRFGNIGKHYTQQFLHRVFTDEIIVEYGLNRKQLSLGLFENLSDALVCIETAIPRIKVSRVCENLKEVRQYAVARYIIESISQDDHNNEVC